jgi:transposase-like protein
MKKDSAKVMLARQMRSEGRLMREIAQALGVCVGTASLWTVGVLPYNKPPVDPRKKAALPVFERMYKAGSPISEIAAIVGVSAQTMYGWRLELGLPRNRRTAYATDEMRARTHEQFARDPDGRLKAEAVRLYVEESKSTPEIAKILGFTSVTISDWLRSAGVETRSRTAPTLGTRQKLRLANLGAKRWNWKGGITPDRVRLRISLYMKLAREACFKRDDYTCRDCGQRGGKLNAHHIWPFQSYPDLKFEVSNLLTLCKECHDSFHKANGGHVHAVVGPFLPARKKSEVRESPAVYQYRLAA